MQNVIVMPTSRDMTQLTFIDYYERMAMLAQSVFKWEGLPNGIDEKHIERFLFHEGQCMFFKDKTFGFMVAKCMESGSLNYYDDPTEVFPVATGYSEHRSYEPGKDTVIIYNNNRGRATRRTVQLYAARIAEIQRTADINIIAQKTPVIVKGSEKQKLSLKAVIRSWFGNEPLIFGDKGLDTSEMKVLNTAAPFVADKLSIEKNKLWNEFLTFLGVNNANTDKRERLVDDEVQANNEQILLSGCTMLQARERAAEAISVLCGQKVTVTLRTSVEGKQAPEDTHKTLQNGGGAA